MCAALAWCALLALSAAGVRAGEGGGGYCARGDPAWRALQAPLALEVRVISTESAGGAGGGSGLSVSVRVRRVLHRAVSGSGSGQRWPRRGRLLRAWLPPPTPGCRARLELPTPAPGDTCLLLAERRGGALRALGPPLRRTPALLRRLRAVYRPGYVRPARISRPPAALRVTPDGRARFECRASGRPPPRISWLLDGRPVEQIALRRLRVLTYRRRSVLVVRHVKRSDSARVECVATGAGGEVVRATTNLTVVTQVTHTTQEPDTGAPCPMPYPSQFCLNGGTCVYFKPVRESACKCPDGFFGLRCEQKGVSDVDQSMSEELVDLADQTDAN